MQGNNLIVHSNVCEQTIFDTCILHTNLKGFATKKQKRNLRNAAS